MNSEIKRKFCGLIMFDVPTMSVKSPKSRNNDDLANNISATRDMIPPYESLNNINGSLINHQNGNNQIVIQNHNNNNDSDFSNTSQALAAGAAASQDDYNASLSSYSNYNNYNNGNNNEGNNDQCDNNNGGNNGKTTQQKRTPRPPNAFILYRRAKQPGIIAAQKHLTNAEVSRQISDMWRSESEEIRLNWERYADRKKLEHMQTYPNYVYRPNKNKSKVDKRRQRRQTSMSSSKDANNESLDNNNNNNNNNNNKSNNTDGNNNNNTNTGPVRRKSKNNKAPIKVEINSQQMNYDIINRYNMQLQQINDSNNPNNNNYVSPTSTSATATPSTATTVTLLPSPEISLLASHFNHQPQQQHHQQHHHQEIVPSQNTATPLTPITPPRQQAIINDNELKFRQQQQQQQQQQGNLPTYVPSNGHHIALPNQDLAYPFNGLTTFHQAANEYHPHQTIDPLELCFVPDVAQQQQQMLAEIMLHHDQHPHPQHHDSPDSSSPPSSSSSPSPIQYFTNGTTTAVDAAVNSVLGNHHSSSFDVFTGLEFQNHYLSGGSVNQGNNGLATTINTNQQQQYLH